MRDVHKLAAELVSRFGPVNAGRRAGCSRQMIAAVARGERKPRAELAAAIEAAAAALPPPKRAPKRKLPKSAARTQTTIEALVATVASIDETLTEDPPATAKASLYRARIDALDRIAKLRGEHEITQAALLRSKAWREVLAAIEPILAEYPDVAEQIANALEGLEA